jgi:hypothetical protein
MSTSYVRVEHRNLDVGVPREFRVAPVEVLVLPTARVTAAPTKTKQQILWMWRSAIRWADNAGEQSSTAQS